MPSLAVSAAALSSAVAAAAASAASASAATSAAVPYSTPPLAWNCWFAFRTQLNASNFMANAKAMVDLGLKDAGYAYANLDGGWQGGRHANGTIYPNATKFPDGLSPVADYVHGLGLKFGVYTDKGPTGCAGPEGSFPFYAQDAAYYASLKADYVKVDSCGGTQDHDGAMALYGSFQSALQAAYAAAGLPMLYYSLCGWYKWYPAAAFQHGIGNSWRIGPDALSWQNVLINWDTAADAWMFTGPGQFNDVDEIGPLGQQASSVAQQESQMNMIAIIGSPLLLSFDLTAYNASTIGWAVNPEVIAVHQDPHPLGPVYRRLVGGPLAQRLISPTTRNACDASNPALVWKRVRSPASGQDGIPEPSYYMYPSTTSAYSLHANHAWDSQYCSHNEQGWLAPSGNATCCDAACSNQLWFFNDSDATVTSVHPPAANIPGPYLTVDPVPNTLFLNQRYNRSDARWAAQRFVFSDATGLLTSLADGTCVGVPEGTMPSLTNVWGRQLSDGSAALVFFNNDHSVAHNLTCDAACFGSMGFTPSMQLAVRDVRNRADAGTVTAGAGFTVSVQPGGASRMFRFTPVVTS